MIKIILSAGILCTLGLTASAGEFDQPASVARSPAVIDTPKRFVFDSTNIILSVLAILIVYAAIDQNK